MSSGKENPLKGLVSYKSAFELVKLFALVIVIAALVTVVVSTYFHNKLVAEITGSIWILDKDGNIGKAEKVVGFSSETRIFEYKDHVKNFYRLWYEMDEGSYQGNVEKALHLAGTCGKELLNEYQEQDVYRRLQEKSLQTFVQIDSVFINMNTSPVSGMIYGIQTIRRPGGELSRNMFATFELFDVTRYAENSHGVKIEAWKIIDNTAVQKQ